MRKHTIAACAIVLTALVAAPVFGQNTDPATLAEKGDSIVSATVGIAFPFALVVYPGFEQVIAQTTIADVLPLEFGIAGRGQFGFFNTSSVYGSYGWITFGAGGFGTAHLALGELVDEPAEWLRKIEVYVSLGMALNFFSYTGDYDFYVGQSNVRLGFASFEGVNYHLSESLALKVEYAYWGFVGNQTTIGAQLKL